KPTKPTRWRAFHSCCKTAAIVDITSPVGSMNTSPYVSFVTWGRNDGYTPDYLRRVDRATNCLASQLERAGVDSEIVIVEWNPVPGRPLLLDVLSLPRSLKHVTIRGFVVGPQYHRNHAGSQERGIQ